MCELEYCCDCDQPTGRAGRGEDSIYVAYSDKEIGPLCEELRNHVQQDKNSGWHYVARVEHDTILELLDTVDELVGALEDARSGMRYIREQHGDLYGVGFDRVEERANKALAKARGEW